MESNFSISTKSNFSIFTKIAQFAKRKWVIVEVKFYSETSIKLLLDKVSISLFFLLIASLFTPEWGTIILY